MEVTCFATLADARLVVAINAHLARNAGPILASKVRAASRTLKGMESSDETTKRTPSIYLDADACPVKEQVYRVAARYRFPVFVVANAALFIRPVAGLEAKAIAVP